MAIGQEKSICVKIGFITVPNSFWKGFQVAKTYTHIHNIILLEEEIWKYIKSYLNSICFFHTYLNFTRIENH